MNRWLIANLAAVITSFAAPKILVRFILWRRNESQRAPALSIANADLTNVVWTMTVFHLQNVSVFTLFQSS